MRSALSILEEAKAIGERHRKLAAAYTGGPKYFHHMGHKREAALPWLSDVEMAGEVRMLMRDDLDHEGIVCAARDRILHLSEELAALRGAICWQTMDTAPKDGTEIIVFAGRAGTKGALIAHWAQNLSGEEQPAYRGWFYWTGHDFTEVCDPVAWMPTPAEDPK